MTLRLFAGAIVTAVLIAAGGSVTVAAPALAETGVSNGQSYTVTLIDVDGHTPSGLGTWAAELGQIDGGDPAVAKAFNDASYASLRWQVDQGYADDAEWRTEITSVVTFTDVTVSELLTGVYFATGAAHPVSYISTVVIDSRTAQPVTLADLFVDQQAGLDVLSEQTKLHLGPQLEQDLSQAAGARPLAENFDSWIPTAAGLEIHYEDYQFVHGLPTITVPWETVRPLLSPDMVALTQS